MSADNDEQEGTPPPPPPSNVILVHDNEVAEQMLRLQDIDRVTIATATQSDDDDEMTDEDDGEGGIHSAGEENSEDNPPDGRCYEEGEIESDDEYGEDCEIIRTLMVFQFKEGVEPDEEEIGEEDMVERGEFKLKCLSSRGVKKCRECRRQFASERSLVSHQRLHTEGEKKYPCRYCQKTFREREDREEHRQVHNGEFFFACSKCGKRFSSPAHLAQHEPSHEGLHECIRCGQRLMTKKALRLHMSREHVDSGPGRRGRPRKVIPEQVGPGMYLYGCDQCGKKYTTLGILKTHRQIHAQERYRCEDCDKAFSTLAYLKQHLRIHDKSRSYMCQYCGKTFVEPWYCKRHELTHTDSPALKCRFCGAGFSVITTYRRHLRTHTGEKPFVCPYCGKRFTEKGTLRRHERTHTGDKPYPCKYCDKKFSVLHAMKRHTRTHDLEKAFPCKLCSRAYYDKGSLVRHEKHHKHTAKELGIAQHHPQPVEGLEGGAIATIIEGDTLEIVEAPTLEGNVVELLTTAHPAKDGGEEQRVGGDEQRQHEMADPSQHEPTTIDTIQLLTSVKHPMSAASDHPLHHDRGGVMPPVSEHGGVLHGVDIGGGDPVRTQVDYHHQGSHHQMIHTVPSTMSTHPVATHLVTSHHQSEAHHPSGGPGVMQGGGFMGGGHGQGGRTMYQQVQLQDGRSVFATVFENGAPGNWQVHVHDSMPVNR